MKNPFRRPDVEFVVTAGRSRTGEEALMKHQMFVQLCLDLKIDIVETNGRQMTLRGRKDRADKFQKIFETFSKQGIL